jgi:hypothetical protein
MAEAINLPIQIQKVDNLRTDQILVGLMFSISFFAVMLRVYTRAAVLKSFGKDDWTMILALVNFPPGFLFLLCG